jgi:hypothetical protein
MKLFGKPTFESITSGLSGTIQQLDQLADDNLKEEDQKTTAISMLEIQIANLAAERAKATKVAANLRSLIEA